MKKHLLTLILTLLAANASAEWQSIGENATQTAYVDAANIQHGKHNTMWGLFDLKAPRTLGNISYLSMKIQREYSCHNKKSRIIARSAHADNMGAGEIIYSDHTPDKWMIIQPDSAEAALWNIACDKKPQ
ncbi:MAG: hypothetical protein Q7T38_03795 [Gallionella sp.]|nr:hypothetical protein [Gallionella sp.]